MTREPLDEQEIERIARGLGREAAEQIDAERVAAAVVQRLRAEPAVVKRVWGRWVASAAATVAVVLGGTFAVMNFRGGEDPELIVSVSEFYEPLSGPEWQDVLDSLLIEVPVYEYAAGGMELLDEEELRRLLQLMEG